MWLEAVVHVISCSLLSLSMIYNFILYLKSLYANNLMDLTDDRFKAQIHLGTCTLVANLSKRIVKGEECELNFVVHPFLSLHTSKTVP